MKFVSFFTSINKLQNFEFVVVANMLTNNIFSHRITLKNETMIFNNFNFYVFNIFTNSRYNNTKFKKFFIDSNTVIKSTNNINQ